MPPIVAPLSRGLCHRSYSMLPVILLVPFLFNALLIKAQPIGADQVQDIRTLSTRINADSTLRKVILHNGDFLGDEVPTGGGTLTGYFKQDTLCKMTVWVGLSYGVVRETYYFDRGALIFVDETEDDYLEDNSTGGSGHGKPQQTFEGRYYFQGDVTISTLTKGKKKLGPDDTHHPTELYHNAHYYFCLLVKKERRSGKTLS
jgi:hypothetical protein